MGSRLGFGFKVGHWTDPNRITGCTVVLPPAGNVTSCDIRGSSPGSRELALLHPDRRLTEVHAILLAGGSAFGLAAADGVVSWLEEREIGYRTSLATIPIVPGAVVFDLGAANKHSRPGPEAGRAACADATEDDASTGRVGAGTGATVGKWTGRENAVPGGLGIGSAEAEGQRASALAVVNSVGDVVDAQGRVLAGSSSHETPARGPSLAENEVPFNTVLAVVAFEGGLDKREVRWLAARGSDGITQSVRPAHTRYDGDITFAVSAPRREGLPAPDLDVLGRIVTDAVAAAVREAVR
jgi:L-aminopeptidase/D-esterase-like protein